MRNSKPLNVSLSLEMIKEIEKVAEKNHLKKSAIIMMALEEYLQRHKIDDKPNVKQ